MIVCNYETCSRVQEKLKSAEDLLKDGLARRWICMGSNEVARALEKGEALGIVFVCKDFQPRTLLTQLDLQCMVCGTHLFSLNISATEMGQSVGLKRLSALGIIVDERFRNCGESNTLSRAAMVAVQSLCAYLRLACGLHSASPASSALASIIGHQDGIAILDGGLGSELQARGYDVSSSLWSAQILLDKPLAIKEIHRAYLDAGADIIITSSYQASFEGLKRMGVPEDVACSLLLRSVSIAQEAIQEHIASQSAPGRKHKPIVAASIGCYGAAMANGSEYTGSYDLDESGLVAWHRKRLLLLSDSGADMLACETIPRLSEVRALLRLLQEVPSVRAWITVCCKSGNELSSGESLHEFVSLVLREDILGQVIALGVNCTAPVYIDECLQCMKEALGTSGAGRLIIVYPNSGEEWDCNSQKWKVEVETECDISSQQQSFVRRAVGWREAGAVVIGGCCRTTPEIIQSLCIALKRETT